MIHVPVLGFWLRHPFGLIAFVVLILQISGFCWHRFEWTSDEEIIDSVIVYLEKYNPDIRDDLNMDNCCGVARTWAEFDDLFSFVLSTLFGIKSWDVVIETEAEQQPDYPHERGTLVTVGKCGKSNTRKSRWQ